MGIRFFCPNGHKLHVKSFQAGHKGICPFCGAAIDIPLTSTRGSSKGSSGEKSQHSPSPDDEEGINLNAIAPGSAQLPCLDNNSFVAYDKDQEIELCAPLDRSVSVPALQTASVSAGSSVPAGPTDPFAEAPQAVWYVRPSSGDQYGPASADIMKSWLDEGRVASDSLVWREGWPDWKEAQSVFPQFAPATFSMDIFSSKEKPKPQSQSVNISISATSTQQSKPSSIPTLDLGLSKPNEATAGNKLYADNAKTEKNSSVHASGSLVAELLNWKDPRNIIIMVQTTIILILFLVVLFK